MPDRFQPMNLSINKPNKSHLQSSFQSWYASQVKKQIQQAPDQVSFPQTCIQALLSQYWLSGLLMLITTMYIKIRPEIVIYGFKAAGILHKIGT